MNLSRVSMMSLILGLASIIAALCTLYPYLRGKMNTRNKKKAITKQNAKASELGRVDGQPELLKNQALDAGGFRELVERAKAVSI